MIIFDIFGFKKQAQKILTKENIENVMNLAKEAIIGEIKSNIPGEEKKAVVDAIVLAKIDELLLGVNNKLVIWLVELLKGIIPNVTQLIYNFLKDKIENL